MPLRFSESRLLIPTPRVVDRGRKGACLMGEASRLKNRQNPTTAQPNVMRNYPRYSRMGSIQNES